MSKKGLVLSGSGAKGAYEAGVVKALIDAKIKFDVIVGTSVGGLNATLIASNQIDDLIKIWEEKITNKSIFTFNPNLKVKFTLGDILLLLPIIPLFWIKKKIRKTLFRLNSIGDSSLIRNLVKNTVNIDNLRSSGNRLILTGTNLQIGEKETFVKTEDGKFFIRRKDFGKEIKEEEFEKMVISTIMATFAIPVAFKPEVILGYQYIDGGIGSNTPLMNAIAAKCKDIFIILTKPPQRTPLDTQFDSLLSIGARTIEIFLENIIEEDIQRARLINDVILDYQKMADGIDILLKNVKDKEIVHQIQTVIEQSFPFKKHIEKNKGLINNIIIQPDRDINLELFEFDPEKLKKAVRQGYQDGCKKLEELAESGKLEELEGKRLECVECKYAVGCQGKKIDKKFYDTINKFIGSSIRS